MRTRPPILTTLLLLAALLAGACAGDTPEAIATNDGGLLVKPPDVLDGETDVIDGQDQAPDRVEPSELTVTPEAAEAASAEAGDTAGFVWFDGTPGTLADLAGTPVVLNFWASSCPPCIAEMPEFEAVHVDLGDQVTFVGMNTGDRRAAAEQLAERTGVTYRLAEDGDGSFFRSFRGFVMPTTVFLDAAGEVVYTWAGVLTETELRILIDEHLSDPTSTDDPSDPEET